MEKVYKVEFMNYTNSCHNAVYSESTDSYISVGKEPFLIKESELSKYELYGGGFRTLTFVGNIEKIMNKGC